jgi:hypothetical protein
MFAVGYKRLYKFRNGKRCYCKPECRKAGRLPRIKIPLPERFMANVEIQPDGCWKWTGLTDSGGYGKFFADGRYIGAHKWAYEHFSGEKIPNHLEADHVCHRPEICRGGKGCPHRRCVNPEHIETVTRKKNASPERSRLGAVTAARKLAKTTCVNGHEWTEENTWVNPKNGWRYCRTCRRERSLEYYYRRTKHA